MPGPYLSVNGEWRDTMRRGRGASGWPERDESGLADAKTTEEWGRRGCPSRRSSAENLVLPTKSCSRPLPGYGQVHMQKRFCHRVRLAAGRDGTGRGAARRLALTRSSVGSSSGLPPSPNSSGLPLTGWVAPYTDLTQAGPSAGQRPPLATGQWTVPRSGQCPPLATEQLTHLGSGQYPGLGSVPSGHWAVDSTPV